MRALQTLFALVLFASITVAAFGQDREEVILESGGLPAGEPELALPRGAVIHIRINGLEPLLNDVDELVRQLFSRKMLPEESQGLLDQKNFLLAMIGQEAMGAPINAAQLSGMLGMDLNRPITLSFYPQLGQDGLALALPMKDPAAITSLIQGMFNANQMTRKVVNGKPVFLLDGNNPDLPQDIYIACSDDAAYVVSHPDLFDMLLATGDFPRLKESPLVNRAVGQMKNDNIALLIDPDVLKPMLPQLAEMKSLPPDAVQGMREEVYNNLTQEDVLIVEQMLREQMGIRDFEQGLDYAEAILTASYEVLAQALIKEAENFDGVLIGIDLSGRDQSVNIALLSQSIKPSESAKPIPIEKISSVLSKLPGDKHFFTVQGQTPKAEPSTMLMTWMDRVEQKMTAKNLPMDFFNAAKSMIAATQPMQSLESRVPWTVETRIMSPEIKSVTEFESTADYLTYLSTEGVNSSLWANVKAMPKQSDSLLEKHFAEMAEATNDNDAAYRNFLKEIGQAQPFYDKVSQSRRENIEGDVSKLVYENRYITRGGLFGYNQHELINRQFILYRHLGDLTFVHEGAPSPLMLQSIGTKQSSPESVARLLGMAPKGTTHIELIRLGGLPVQFMDYLVNVESLIHRETQAYLDEAQAVVHQAENEGAEAEIVDRLMTLKMPLSVSELKLNPDSKEVYAVLGPGIAFPRPKVMPEFRSLLDEYAKQADSAGGFALFQSVNDGEASIKMVFDAKGYATFQRTFGENIFTRYIEPEDGEQRIMKLLSSPLDERVDFDPTILTNPAWQNVIQGMRGGFANNRFIDRHSPKSVLAPGREYQSSQSR